MFTPFISMVGVTGSMGPFFCEFTLNGDLLPANYPATYAHELAHLLGITSEAEANFYAYQVCTRSQAMGIRFSGYFSVLNHVLGNAQRLLPKEEYAKLLKRIRPEIIELAKANQTYWAAKYSPVVGAVQGLDIRPLPEREQDRERSPKLFGGDRITDFLSRVEEPIINKKFFFCVAGLN